MGASFLSYPLRLSTRFDTFASTPVHLEMLTDSSRTTPFQRAIAAQVKPGMRVIDVGAGSGILGLWALTAGAAHLDAVDATELASTLDATFAANGFAGRAKVHTDYSSKVSLPQRADVVIAEVLGHYGIDEGILATCADVKQRLAKADALFIPARVDVVAWPVWVPDFEQDLVGFWQRRPHGYDLGAVSRLSRQGTYACNEHDGQRIADNGVLSSHLVGDQPAARWQGRASFTAAFKSDWNGFFLSFVADLGAGVMLEGWRTRNWKTVFLPAPEPKRLTKGDPLGLEVIEGTDGVVRYSVTP